MLSFGDFKCENLIHDVMRLDWYCRRRHSTFVNIDAHCGDCPTYIGFLDKLVKELNANGYLRSESEKRA